MEGWAVFSSVKADILSFFSPSSPARLCTFELALLAAQVMLFIYLFSLYQRLDRQSNKQIVGKLGAMQRFVGMRSCLASSQLI